MSTSDSSERGYFALYLRNDLSHGDVVLQPGLCCKYSAKDAIYKSLAFVKQKIAQNISGGKLKCYTETHMSMFKRFQYVFKRLN